MPGGDDGPAAPDPLPLRNGVPARPGRDVRRLPRLLKGALVLTWRAARNELLWATAVQVVAALAMAGQLLVGRRALQALLALRGAGDLSDLLVPLAVLAVLTAVVVAARIAQLDQQRLLADLTAHHALRQVLEVATTVELLEYERPGYHDRLQRALVNAQTRPSQMASGVLGLITGGVTVAAISGGLLLLQPEIVALALLAFVPGWYASNRASLAAYQFTVAQTERERRRSYLAFVLADRSRAHEVRAFGLRHYFLRAYDRLHEQRMTDLRRLVRQRMLLGVVGAVTTSLAMAATFGVLGWFVSSGRTSLSAAGAAGGGIILLGQRLRGLSTSAGSLYESSLFIEDFVSFVADAGPVAPPSGGLAPPPFSRAELADVWFRYPGDDRPALRAAALHVDAGEVVALVGENGSGKTTLAKVLAGLYRPDEGRVLWDGVDAANYDQEQARRSIAVVFQDFVKYFMSARANIEVGRPEAGEQLDGVVEAARRAGVHDDLARLPLGYDTLLGPEFLGGTDLSAGQWQRLALARAFHRDPALLILDEPTASLDPRAESRLFETMHSLFRDRAVLLISHRFSSVRAADRIYVLEDGAITEAGSHDELMARGGRYADMFSRQASAYFDLNAERR